MSLVSLSLSLLSLLLLLLLLPVLVLQTKDPQYESLSQNFWGIPYGLGTPPHEIKHVLESKPWNRRLNYHNMLSSALSRAVCCPRYLQCTGKSRNKKMELKLCPWTPWECFGVFCHANLCKPYHCVCRKPYVNRWYWSFQFVRHVVYPTIWMINYIIESLYC